MVDINDSNVFTREYEIDSCATPLILYQREIGDVSCVVWDAALVLASYLQKLAADDEYYLKGRKILELGSGVGCVGLTAACLGADAVLTDLPEVIPLLEQNILANSDVWEPRGTAIARTLNWKDDKNTEDLSQLPDVLLLADCVYYRESVLPLVTTMRRLCREHTEVFVCQEQRPSEIQRSVWTEFMNLLSKNFIVTGIPPSEQSPQFRSPDIWLFKAKLKSTN